MQSIPSENCVSLISHTHLDTTHSTNSQLIAWIYQNFTHQSNDFDYHQAHLVTADTQTGGRGQHGRTWQSPLGNVYLSLYLPIQEFSHNQLALKQRLDGRLSLCVGYQLSQLSLIQEINQQRQSQNLPKIGVKWVNDLGFYSQDDDGSTGSPQTSSFIFHKLAGILIEPVTVQGKMVGIVVGVGVNIAFAPTLTTHTKENMAYQAVCLQDLIEQKLDANDFYQPIAQAILNAIEQFNGFDDIQNVQQFTQDFAQVDVLKNKKLQVTSPIDNSIFGGHALGIDSNGSLQIRQDNGTITPIWTGTIQVI